MCAGRPLLAFAQAEKANQQVQNGQKHADKKRAELEKEGGFQKPVQAPGLRKGKCILIPQGNVKFFLD